MSTETPIHVANPPSELGLLSQEFRPNIEHIVTEDGAPVDNLYSEKQQRFLADSLYNSWKPTETFVAMSNVGLFYAVKKPPFVPDLLVSLGVELPKNPFPKENRSYFIWEYGKAPEAVIEVVSNKDGGEDSIKLKGYAQIGIPNYIILDPNRCLDSRMLRVYRLNGRVYELQADGATFLESLGLGVTLWTGVYEGLEGTWLPRGGLRIARRTNHQMPIVPNTPMTTVIVLDVMRGSKEPGFAGQTLTASYCGQARKTLNSQIRGQSWQSIAPKLQSIAPKLQPNEPRQRSSETNA
jgi:Uma2 family endonuclease